MAKSRATELTVYSTMNVRLKKWNFRRKAALEKSRFAKPIAVGIAPATAFTAAEDYHQDYYKKNPLRYKIYRHGCGREARLEALWGAEAGK